MTMIGGGSFTLNSFDVAELFVRNQAERPNATAVEVIGTLTGGGTVTQTFSLDLFNDGTGAGVDFQTFLLSSVFGALSAAGADLGVNGAASGVMKAAARQASIGLLGAGAVALAWGIFAALGLAAAGYFRPLTRRSALSLSFGLAAVASLPIPGIAGA